MRKVDQCETSQKAIHGNNKFVFLSHENNVKSNTRIAL